MKECLMGRWGDGIYESDASLDFLARITDRIIREITFWTSPEQVTLSSRWLTHVITVVEIILLIDKHKIGSTVFLMDIKGAIIRWRQVFLSVWDAEWNEDESTYMTVAPFRNLVHRNKHRKIMDQWFDRLEEIADYWMEDANTDLEPFQTEKLPYFYLSEKDGKEHQVGSTFVGDLVEELTHLIVFYLSEENHDNAVGFFEIEYVWVSIDVMCYLCDAYTMSAGITEKTVLKWSEKTVSIWKERLLEESREWDEEDQLYKNSLELFEHLRGLARKYPSSFSL